MNRLHRRKRCKHDIIADIIVSLNEPKLLSDIVYEARLNFNVTKKYIEMLLESDLIKILPGSNTYVATKKGLRYLETYRQINQLLS